MISLMGASSDATAHTGKRKAAAGPQKVHMHNKYAYADYMG